MLRRLQHFALALQIAVENPEQVASPPPGPPCTSAEPQKATIANRCSLSAVGVARKRANSNRCPCFLRPPGAARDHRASAHCPYCEHHIAICEPGHTQRRCGPISSTVLFKPAGSCHQTAYVMQHLSHQATPPVLVAPSWRVVAASYTLMCCAVTHKRLRALQMVQACFPRQCFSSRSKAAPPGETPRESTISGGLLISRPPW